jgi:hypothetical protein
MKKTIWFRARLVFSLMVALSSFDTAKAITAAPVTFTWDPSLDGAVTGYALYYRLADSSTNSRLDVGPAKTVTLHELEAGSDYLFFVVGYDASGVESTASNLLSYSPPALSRLQISKQPDGTMSIQFHAAAGALCFVEFASTLTSPQWQTLDSATADANGSVLITDPPSGSSAMRFYRGLRE